MTIFFTSDHHFYHFNIIKYCNRPFDSTEEMNEKMIERWNGVVKPNDTVYYLGDFSLAIRPVELFLNRLNGVKILIAGNHDQCHSVFKARGQRMLSKYIEFGFSEVKEYDSIIINEHEINLHHMPYLNKDNKQEKYAQFRLEDKGKWLLHGHIHSLQQNNLHKRMIDVGVDCNNFTPISLDYIKQLINNNPNPNP